MTDGGDGRLDMGYELRMAGFVERLEVLAWLDDPDAAVELARRAVADGDESWRQWLEDYADGRAVIVCLRLLIACTDAQGDERLLEAMSPGEWVEWRPHIPEVEAQLKEIAALAAEPLARSLQDLGVEVGASQLADMAMRIDLDEALRDRLRDRRASGRT